VQRVTYSACHVCGGRRFHLGKYTLSCMSTASVFVPPTSTPIRKQRSTVSGLSVRVVGAEE
jgi:hypothetical protein